jgi:hypothetical protein
VLFIAYNIYNMSPTHENFRVAPKEIQDELKKYKKRERRRFVQDGFVAVCNENNLELRGKADMPIQVFNYCLLQAKGADDRYHFIQGTNDTKRAKLIKEAIKRKCDDLTIETAWHARGHPDKHRGSHRSHVRGMGIRAFFRIPPEKRHG